MLLTVTQVRCTVRLEPWRRPPVTVSVWLTSVGLALAANLPSRVLAVMLSGWRSRAISAALSSARVVLFAHARLVWAGRSTNVRPI